MNVYEMNMDGLVGPSHHYAGLSAGNLASTANARKAANPKKAALQGLEKMRALYDLGIPQAILPPHYRPNLALLRGCGFTGNNQQILEKAYKAAPELVSACFSASYMWTANAATVCPSVDSMDGKVHFTTANLVSNLHRSQEAAFTHHSLQRIFHAPDYFHHHPVLPHSMGLGDEGAANHNRLCPQHGQPGVQLFVYGQDGMNQSNSPYPKKYPARQSLHASTCIARNHTLHATNTVFASQNPDVIDLGVFHNDVIGVSNEQVLFMHEQALWQQERIIAELREKANFPIIYIPVTQAHLTVEECVSSYLFNSQLVTLPGSRSMLLIAPAECEENKHVKAFIHDLIEDAGNPIAQVRFMDLKQSMRNGGGPACLRLRVVLTEEELQAMHQGVVLSDTLFDTLTSWVTHYYRDRLHAEDLIDANFLRESQEALDALSQILELGSFYPFQEA